MLTVSLPFLLGSPCKVWSFSTGISDSFTEINCERQCVIFNLTWMSSTPLLDVLYIQEMYWNDNFLFGEQFLESGGYHMKVMFLLPTDNLRSCQFNPWLEICLFSHSLRDEMLQILSGPTTSRCCVIGSLIFPTLSFSNPFRWYSKAFNLMDEPGLNDSRHAPKII